MQGKFPDILKITKIIPVHKHGDRMNMENYRPISLLSIFSKVFEKVIYNRLISFLQKYNTINKDQHGFTASKSTETASFEFVEYIHNQLEQNKIVIGLFFDLSRAFDTLNLRFVEEKLYSIGIRDNILSLVMSFLSERRIYVKINDVISEQYPMNIGAAQGSVLAPLIFILYINDLSLPGMTIKFADDTSIAIAADTSDKMYERMAEVCNSMNDWCFLNQQILNKNKTVTMHFHKIISRVSLQKSERIVKLLGTYLDDTFNWEPQIDHICSKLNKAFFAILKLKQSVPKSTLITMYYALAYPHLSYNIILWGQAVNIQQVFINQKRILRLIFDLKRTQSCRNIFKENKILTLASIYIMKCPLYVFKNKDKFKQNLENHQYNTRHRTDIMVPRHSTALYEKSPYYACMKIFNKLPTEIKKIHSMNGFRSTMKKYLCENVYYLLKEFIC